MGECGLGESERLVFGRRVESNQLGQDAIVCNLAGWVRNISRCAHNFYVFILVSFLTQLKCHLFFSAVSHFSFAPKGPCWRQGGGSHRSSSTAWTTTPRVRCLSMCVLFFCISD